MTAAIFRVGQRVSTASGPGTVIAPNATLPRRWQVQPDSGGVVRSWKEEALSLLEEPDMTAVIEVPVKKTRGKKVEAAAVETVEATPPAPVADLPTAPDIMPGTLGVLHVPLHQLVRSPCNVRNHYDAAAVTDIAESLAHQGQLENCTGRWNAEGQIEIVAGETRRRAWLQLRDEGRVDPAQPVLVQVRELTDAQALAISATENMKRRSMTALEECEAMDRLNEAGRTVEEIQAMFAYRTAQPVADRILVARNLHTKPRELLDRGELSLAAAMVIARAPGEELQLSLTRSAGGGHSATALARFLTQGQFLVSHAKFNVEKSGLDIRRDLFDAFEPYFLDKPAALNAQLEWANAQAEKARKKGKHPFVAVESGDSAYGTLNGRKYVHNYDDKGNGLIYFVNTITGEVSTETRYRLKASAVQAAKASGQAGADTPTREMPASAFEAAHVYRARALRHKLLGDDHRTLVLTVHALIVSAGGSNGRAALHPTEVWKGTDITPEIEARLQGWQQVLSVALDTTPALAGQPGELLYNPAQSLRLYDFLVTLDTPELLGLLNALIAGRIYEPHYTDAKQPPAPLYTRLAQEVDADTHLRQEFKFTDEWLKRYPRQELVALAEEAGLGRALVEDCTTQKEMRARLLEHAEQLHSEGFVPKFVRFDEVRQ